MTYGVCVLGSRDAELARRVEVLEEQLAAARGQLQEEGAAVVALKRQSLTFQQELQQMQRDTPRTMADAGLQEVLATLQPLLEKVRPALGGSLSPLASCLLFSDVVVAVHQQST